MSVKKLQSKPTEDVQHNLSDDVLLRIMNGHKTTLKHKYERLYEGVALKENQTLLNSIYTELYITEGESEGVNEKHEVLQIETASRTRASQDKLINCNDIFKPLSTNRSKEDKKSLSSQEPGRDRQKPEIRTVLTKGVAGIGKTVSVQKFILDWAEGRTNQDIDFMLVLPFRELNLIKGEQFSLHGLLLEFHPELRNLDPKKYNDCKILFIFDGFDESQLQLDFSETLCDVTMISSVNKLISNLIKGNLLPSALIWITSRPAAANQIPSQFISRVTEVQGFSDSQKEEYFRKRVRDETQANRIISHIKTLASLHIMCRIPVFCCISATVLQEMLRQDNVKEIPKTLTEMYTHFLLTQTKMKNQKYGETDSKTLLESSKEILLKLAKLAFNQLPTGNIMFYDEDLRECGIDVSEATVYSGICTEIFKEEAVLRQKKVYCFVHLSVQEFFAALYVFYCYVNKNMEALKLEYFVGVMRGLQSLDKLLKGAVEKSLENKTGRLDLFVRFLLGISLESNQKLLQGLLTHTQNNQNSIKKISHYIKKLNKDGVPPERWINLLHCLTEVNDHSLHKEIEAFVKSENYRTELSLAHCTALAYMFLAAEEVLDEFDLKKYNTSDEGHRRLLPAVRRCRKALLRDYKITQQFCEIIASSLKFANCTLRELDLSNAGLQDSGVTILCAALKNPNCQLEILRLALCNLTEQSCSSVASVLQSVNCPLNELDLSNNDLQDSGVKLLCVGLKNPHCKLEILRLSGCLVTEEGCSVLASALRSNPSHLRELDLSYNHPADSGVKLLSTQMDQHCQLNVDHGGEFRIKPGLQKYACDLTMDRNTVNTELTLSKGKRKVTHVRENQWHLNHPDRYDYWYQVMCGEELTGRCYWETELTGDAVISVTYKGMWRKGRNDDCEFGDNDKSWNLICSGNSYSACHNHQRTVTPALRSRTHRVGVYLDWSSGTVSFYNVSSDTHTLTHIHTFHCTFTEPLYAGFYVFYGSSVSLCQI
ncbi:NACHT, LRR and PYD domains-containing protein 12-like [Chanos chanos]|uniref:NACHT, LRR and PYD domains-containing protein 12-like n=1 Tax=Chanos chanos TaxID=29144 RepID=A0A6J2WK88_CHACN|nr:NACHT, LRR and PYD domains-containing protein 12-like [Chanos chanos]